MSLITFEMHGQGAFKQTTYVVAIDVIDSHLLKRTWRIGQMGYAIRCTKVDGKTKTHYLHREILGLTNSKLVVDHIDGNPLNNSRNNMRICTQGENVRNSRPRLGTSSKYKGVSLRKNGTWCAAIKFQHRSIHLGYFQTELEAAIAYNEACIRFFGEFARPNVLVGAL